MTARFDHWIPEQVAESSDPLPEITYAELLREISPLYRSLDDEQVDEALEEALDTMSAEDIEGFFSSLGRIAKRVGRTLVRAAPKVLPVVGGAVGTLVGGPVGTAIGSKLGGVAGGLIGRATQRPRRRPRPRRRTRARRTAGRRRVGRRSPASAQLLSLLQNPAMLQSLLGRILGDSQASTVNIGEEAVAAPFGAFMNALEVLAAEAAAEAHSGGDGIPEYLIDSEGETLVDVNDDLARAEHLLELLAEEEWADEAEEFTDLASESEVVAAWLEQAV